MTRRTTLAFALFTTAVTNACFTARGSGANAPAGAATPITHSAAFEEIRQMMAASATAWNRGDLARFVSDYTIDATFIGRHGVIRGPVAITDVYRPRFAPGGTRDSLSFENIEVDLIAPDAANVIAYYRLTRGDSTTALGPTSLVMRRANGRWRIAHDHSS